jgi:hypothetical protein
MGHRYSMSVHRIGQASRARRRIKVRNDLMAKQVEIDPVIAAPSLFTTQHAAIKSAGGVKVMDRKGEMKWAHGFFYRANPA